MLINETQQKTISAAIAAVERHTNAELVTVLAHRADDYRYVGFSWAALVALVSPTLLLMLPFWLDLQHILLTQCIVFTLCALLFQWEPLRRLLVPKKLARWHASNLARRQFLENNLHHTEGESGVLIFVTEFERYVEIIADRGISRKVPDTQWQAIVDEFITAVKAGKTEEGFLRCIEQCGKLLQEHSPAEGTRNELPDRLVLV